MKKLIFLAGFAVLAAPGIGNAGDVGLRFGLETPLYAHFSQNGRSGSFSIGDTFQPALNVIVEYYPASLIGLGLEAREGFLATGSGYTRTGTFIGPNLTLDFAPIPIFARATVPIHVEPDNVRLDFRAAGGLKIGLPSIAFYAEVLLDFPLAGTGISAFGTQQFGLGAGIWLKI